MFIWRFCVFFYFTVQFFRFMRILEKKGKGHNNEKLENFITKRKIRHKNKHSQIQFCLLIQFLLYVIKVKDNMPQNWHPSWRIHETYKNQYKNIKFKVSRIIQNLIRNSSHELVYSAKGEFHFSLFNTIERRK